MFPLTLNLRTLACRQPNNGNGNIQGFCGPYHQCRDTGQVRTALLCSCCLQLEQCRVEPSQVQFMQGDLCGRKSGKCRVVYAYSDEQVLRSTCLGAAVL